VRIEESLGLPVDPETLWPWISTPERLARWIGDVDRFEVRPAGDLVQGSLLIVHLSRGAPLEATVERVERPWTLALRARGLPDDLEAFLGFRVQEEAGGTRLTMSAEAELHGLMIFAEKLIAAKARAKLSAWTEALRGAMTPR